MKKTFYHIYAIVAVLLLATSCSFLNNDPEGIYTEGEVSAEKNLESLCISAYAALGNDHYDTPLSGWAFGSVRSDDAYKGGRDETDMQELHFYEICSGIQTNFGAPDAFWYQCYVAISRANTAIRALEQVDSLSFPQRDCRIAEMRFLRGHFHFLLKTMYKAIPYIAEHTDIEHESNVHYSNDSLWQLIANDFAYGVEHLPAQQPEVGRASKYAAAAYLAKTYLYKAYRQDEQHNVTEISREDLEQVLTYTAMVQQGPFRLEGDYATLFLPEGDNCTESVFSVQYSTGDGTKYGRVNLSNVLNFSQGVGGCDFHKPSQNLVNAFRTENGLPLFDSFNDADRRYGYQGSAQLNNYQEAQGEVDPRLYHTVAMPGFPYKYDYKTYTSDEWNRNVPTYGIYASLKEVVSPESDAFVKMPPFLATSMNRMVIRYADVLLMRAEAQIELGENLDEARNLINQVRERAQHSRQHIGYAKNCRIDLYPSSVASQDDLRRALRWERRLEFAMEGGRFFDLTRWGIAAEVMNSYFTTEQTLRTYMRGAHFDKNKEEYMPIPLQQMSYAKGLYQQNYGY